MDVTEDDNSWEDIGDTGDDNTEEDMDMNDMNDKKSIVAKQTLPVFGQLNSQ